MVSFSRRHLLTTSLAAGVAGSVLASPLSHKAHAAPRRGGQLRIGIHGANSSDSWDARTQSDSFMVNVCHGAAFDCLTEFKADGTLGGELAESWSASRDAKIWRFKLRRGVRFHNGKPFGADDVLASLQMHLEEGAKSAAKPIISAITEMKKLGEHEVELHLEASNADFPYLLSDYHIVMYPAGMIDEAIRNGIGTGPYRAVSLDPGVRAVLTRIDDHYMADEGGYFEDIEAIAINDPVARTNALITGQVDVISRIDLKTVPLVKANPAISILSIGGNQHYTFPMLVAEAPFNDVNVRRALKFACDRQEMVDKILLGHGTVGNDSPIGPANQFVARDIPQTRYDPDRAKYYLQQAGLDELRVQLSVSDAAFTSAVDAGQLYQNSAKAAGITIDLVQEPADGYWSNVWQKKPWCASYWSGRATEDAMWTTGYEISAPWNDTGWDNPRFQSLIHQGRAELDDDKRRAIYREMQMLISQEGATVIPMFANYVDAHNKKVAHGDDVGNIWLLDNSRVCKRWWMA
ncbi:MAG: ABC transporter substrate-binding protein [Proteobacteria bacterium]|nr:ABC transporter substrate-binding protein [Pseudomonadota bacterium]